MSQRRLPYPLLVRASALVVLFHGEMRGRAQSPARTSFHHRLPGHWTFAGIERPTKFGLVGVMRAAAQLQVGCDGRAAVGKRRDVMKFEVARFAASACCADECAPTLVPPPNFPFHRG